MNLVDSPTRVSVNLLVRSISKIDDYKMVSAIHELWNTNSNKQKRQNFMLHTCSVNDNR